MISIEPIKMLIRSRNDVLRDKRRLLYLYLCLGGIVALFGQGNCTRRGIVYVNIHINAFLVKSRVYKCPFNAPIWVQSRSLVPPI